MMYTIQNTFHNTTATTKYSPQERDIAPWDMTDAERQAMRRAHNKLCGSSDCTCSNSWGERNN